MENLIKKWNSLNGDQKRAFGDRWITHDTNLDAWDKDFEDLSNLKRERVLASIGDIEPKDLNLVVGSGIAGKIKENRGGKREGAGAKPKYSEPTKTKAFRIPISKIEEVKEVVNRMLSGYAENNQ